MPDGRLGWRRRCLSQRGKKRQFGVRKERERHVGMGRGREEREMQTVCVREREA
jgi:hypothetical protein